MPIFAIISAGHVANICVYEDAESAPETAIDITEVTPRPEIGWAVDGANLKPPTPELGPDGLRIYAKAKRDEAESAGVTVNGVAVASDPESQSRVSNAYSGMGVTGAESIRFKASGGFITLTLDQVKAIGSALFAHTQACFDAEGEVSAGIDATPPTITTLAQVDAAFGAVQRDYTFGKPAE